MKKVLSITEQSTAAFDKFYAADEFYLQHEDIIERHNDLSAKFNHARDREYRALQRKNTKELTIKTLREQRIAAFDELCDYYIQHQDIIERWEDLYYECM